MPVGPATPKPTRKPRDPNDSQATISSEFGDLRGTDVTKPRPRKKIPTSAPAPKVETSTTAPKPAANLNHWEADGAGQRGKGLAWIAGILGICLVALVLILYMVSSMLGKDPGSSLAQNDTSQTTIDDQSQVAAAEKEAAEKRPEDDASASKTKTAAPAKSEAPDPNDDSAQKDSDPNTKPPTEPRSDAENVATTDSTSTSKTDPATTAEPSPDNASAPETEPPFELDPDAAINASGNTIAMDQEQDQQSILDEFSGIGDLVFDPGIDMEEFRETTSDDQTQKYGIGKVYVPVPRRLSVVPEEAMSESYPELSFNDLSLIDFTRHLFSLTQVPHHLDGQSIIDGLLDPQASVSVSASPASPAELLTAALTPHQLEWNWNANKTGVIISAQRSAELVPEEIPLAPVLGINEENAQKLLDGIRLIIAPETWNASGGKATIRFADSKLMLEQTPSVIAETRELLDQLTLAAQIKANPDDQELISKLQSVYTRTQAVRDAESDFHSLQLQPIADILQDLHQQFGLTIVVNWDEAATENWNPNVRIPWLSKEQTFEKTLRDLTTSMGLAYRLLNAETIEITSKPKYWSATRLEIYPCGRQLKKRFSGEQIIQFLKEGIAADLPRNAMTQVIFSPDYECIIAVLPDPLHIRVEKILEQLADRQ